MEIEDDRILKTILKWLNKNDITIICQAAKCLQKKRFLNSGKEELLKILHHSEPAVQMEAAMSLSLRGG